jgi:hypothetical protein
MTPALKKAVEAIEALPDSVQNTFAGLIMAEIEDQRLWEEKFSRMEQSLGRWAEKVRADVQAGRVQRKGIDEL